jgi:hypothetical protein
MEAWGGGIHTSWEETQRDIHMLSNKSQAPAEENFCDDNKYILKTHIIENHNNHIHYVGYSNWMVNSYSMGKTYLQLDNKIFSFIYWASYNWTVEFYYLQMDLNILTKISDFSWWEIW